MQHLEIKIASEADSFLKSLPLILVKEGYKSSLESALSYVDELLDFISRIDTYPHYELSVKAQEYFSRYGQHLKYTFLRRKSSPQTTWYVFFECLGNRLIVRYITNNWMEGQFIR